MDTFIHYGIAAAAQAERMPACRPARRWVKEATRMAA